MNTPNSPLITLVVFAYNQEKYILESVQSAFAQDYSPLQIVLSDDCSPDATFSIMEELAAQYQGPHVVKLNRNEKNLGIARHFNQIPKLASGEFIIMQAGDDISLPNRATVIANTWLSGGKKAFYIHSDVIDMDINGKHLKTRQPPHTDALNDIVAMATGNPHAIGASECFNPDLFNKFGPLNPGVVHEDRVLPFRASLMGECVYIREPLLYYREGGISSGYCNLSHEELLYGEGAKIAQRYAEDFRQKLEDYQKINTDPLIEKKLMRKVAEWQLISAWGSARGIRLSSLWPALKSGCTIAFLAKQMIKYGLPKLYESYIYKTKQQGNGLGK